MRDPKAPAAVADSPDWPGCHVCSAAPSVFAVDTREAYSYPQRVQDWEQDLIRKGARTIAGTPVIDAEDFMGMPGLAPWRTYCPQHEDEADYALPVGDWRSTVANAGHVMATHEKLTAGSNLGDFLQCLANYGRRPESTS